MLHTIAKAAKGFIYKGFDKNKEALQKLYPDESESRLRQLYNKTKTPSLEPNTKKTGQIDYQKIYGEPIFSSSPHVWFMDLFINSSNPEYYYIFLGANNHYAEAYPVNSASVTALLPILRRFVNSHEVLKLISDDESAFISSDYKDFCEDHDIEQRIINVSDEGHHKLGLIDRFSKTIRDMNHMILKRDGLRVSDTTKREPVTIDRMREIIKTYNNTPNARIGMTPTKMYENPTLEEKYIIKHLEYKELGKPITVQRVYHPKPKTPIKDFKTDGSYWVKFRMNYGALDKKRGEWSDFVYPVVGKNGNRFTIQSKDGDTKQFTRYNLHLVSTTGKPEFSQQGEYFEKPKQRGRPVGAKNKPKKEPKKKVARRSSRRR